MTQDQHKATLVSYGGSTKHTSYTLAGIADLDAFQSDLQRLLGHSLADLYILRGTLPGEEGFDLLSAESKKEDIRDWALRHYRANGIGDHESIQSLYSDRIAYIPDFPLARLKREGWHASCLNRSKIEAYAEMRRRGIHFPPLVVSHARNLYEGFHRAASAEAVGMTTHPVIRL